MDQLLKYATLITIAGAAISFVVGLIKWIDQRNREQDQKDHQAFHRMICLASGRSKDGRTISLSQQVAAVYQLQAYRRYGFATVPVLELFKFENARSNEFLNDPRSPHLARAIDETIAVLSESKK